MLRAEDYVRVQKDGGVVTHLSLIKTDRRVFAGLFFSPRSLLGDELIDDVADLLGRGSRG